MVQKSTILCLDFNKSPTTGHQKGEHIVMMINEFTKLTGIYPTADLYKAIEAAYYEFDGDKVAFCRAYKENADGLAEVICNSANAAAEKAQREHAAELSRKDIQIDALTKQVEREQEWKPYVDTNNYQQNRYDELRKAGRVMTDDEAKDLLYDEFGFAREKVTIYHSIPAYEVNRHRQLRKVGEIERLPLYEATDWNYIRFDCGRMTYELINDDVRPFLH